MIMCPHCGEDRQVEPVQRPPQTLVMWLGNFTVHVWLCNVCAREFLAATGPTEGIGGPRAKNAERPRP